MSFKDKILYCLVTDLAKELEPLVPKMFGVPIIDINKELMKNSERIKTWLKTNKKLISQL